MGTIAEQTFWAAASFHHHHLANLSSGPRQGFGPACSRGHEDAEVVADVALRVTRQEHAAEEAVVEAHEVLHADALDHVRICSGVSLGVLGVYGYQGHILLVNLVSNRHPPQNITITVPHAAPSCDVLMSCQDSMGFALTTVVQDMT